MTITQIPSQGSVGADGLLLHEGDHVAQLALALENLEQALADAGLAPADLVELRVRTTDRRLFDDASEVLADRLAEHGIRPMITVTEVSRLDQPGMTITVQPITGSSMTAQSTTSQSITSHKGETSMTIDFTRTSCPIHLPGDPGYDQARTPWAVQVDQRPAAVAVPRTAAEVVEAVLAAIDARLRIAPQSSGHGASPFAAADLSDVMLIRLHELTGVTIDADRRIARVLGGTLWQPVVEAAAAYGLAARHGSSPDVAVAGYTLGGGLSWYARQHGLAAHHLTAVEIVLADGRLVRADAENEPDLFWALKGGGGSFGIVTALEFELLPIADAYAGMLLWPGERAAEVARAWAQWTRTAPESATTACRLMSFPPLPELPPFLSGRKLVVIDGAVLESDERAAEILAPLRALAPELDTFARVPLTAMTRIHLDPEGPTPSVSNSIMLSELEPETIDALLAVAGPDSGSSVLAAEIRHLGGALARPADAAVATLPGTYLGFFVAIAPFPEAAAIGLADATRAVEALAPWGTGGRYLNFDDNVVEVSAAYGHQAWQRLQQIRAQVDPQGRMVANHGV
ncbi:oxidoreductase [Microlunatus phosphovorus NM-1]|uniref:Oxidoreductase n=1 Tax=Microlunatus phosphovorus (strain ATCC 700054 / DSM 10555 / JCM 9379 / NBRC 101784 / NCIMB 13414 / VKM Ac-1990 / NM-1) TaxID=1032480 RepID=F5XIB5_MICPN|nr:FAD-binding protein [Microlunatus phosphovorus]BAK35784.1 oxidoreductase [Microlunatus phosphovorus NM-1]